MNTQESAPTGPDASGSGTAAQTTVTREAILYPDDQPKDARDGQAALTKEPLNAPSADKPPAAAPDMGEYKLQAPDGYQVDQEFLTNVTPVLREAGISNEQANKLAPLVTQVQERLQRAQLDEFTILRSDWAKKAKADPELGGKNWSETARLGAVALNAGGAASKDHEARKLLDDSGLGNHPAILRVFRRMGAEIERLRGGKGSPMLSSHEESTQSHQRSIYPNDPPRRAAPAASLSGSRGNTRSERAYPNDQPKP